MRQSVKRFRITAEQEIGPQLRARGLSPADVRWVVLTHLHQDHDGGLHHFPQAEVIVARAKWQVAQGMRGRAGWHRAALILRRPTPLRFRSVLP